MRRARTQDLDEAMFRRSFNYDEQPATSGDRVHGQTGVSESGLIFVAFQCDVEQQCAVSGGCQEGGFIGEELFAEHSKEHR